MIKNRLFSVYGIYLTYTIIIYSFCSYSVNIATYQNTNRFQQSYQIEQILVKRTQTVFNKIITFLLFFSMILVSYKLIFEAYDKAGRQDKTHDNQVRNYLQKQFENSILQMVFKHTYLIKNKFKYLLSYQCEVCNQICTFTGHAYDAKQCVFEFDHNCPLLRVDIHQFNLITFQLFCLFSFLFNSMQVFNNYTMIMKKMMVSSNYNIKESLVKQIFSIISIQNKSICIYLINFMVFLVTGLTCLIMFILQLLPCVRIFSTNDICLLKNYYKQVKKNLKRLVLFEYSQFDQIQNIVVTEYYYFIHDIDPGIPKNEIADCSTNLKVMDYYDYYQSCDILKRGIKHKSWSKVEELFECSFKKQVDL